MSEHVSPECVESPPVVEELAERARDRCEEIISFCTAEKGEESFYRFERALMPLVSGLGVIFMQLFLAACHQRLGYEQWLSSGLYYLKTAVIYRTIKTVFGEVRYGRNYLVRKGRGGGGFYPLDAVYGLSGDGFSPLVMSLATQLATRMSFRVAVLVFRGFYGWAPSSTAVQELVLGMGREAGTYMEQAPPPEDDGEVLVIEVDGKATPTATEEELRKRRGKRSPKRCPRCGCQRHRGQAKRRCRRRKRRKRGDKSKNGRSITLAVMYTLRRSADGQLHGPLNKRVWGSYAPRRVMIAWARSQATKRGFAPGTDQRIHIVVDGEKCLREGLKKAFPEASFALDIRHAEEKLWKTGRAFHTEGSDALEQWVEEKRTLLYTGQVERLIAELKALAKTLSQRAKRDQAKREALDKLIGYLEPRLDMMAYQQLIEQDLVIASGVVEGAARYVVGERMDCSGMRWIPGRGEALLHLRCIELNGDWEPFFEWGYQRWMTTLQQGEKVMIQTVIPSPNNH